MSKHYTLSELITYRNKMLIRARARTKTFQDNTKNYYWKRLNEIDTVLKNNYPNQINTLGLITSKKKGL
jgi:hypothetical protein